MVMAFKLSNSSQRSPKPLLRLAIVAAAVAALRGHRR